MSILALVAVPAATFGAGLFLGAIALKPKVGPWYGRPVERPARVMRESQILTTELTRGTTPFQGQVSPGVTPVVYVLTDRGLTPLALPSGSTGDLTAPAALTLPAGASPSKEAQS
ncbi:hypothetical protein [Microtetraspora malaysiensis]|uniref:hypothetical protein n=1 Tax=Microtetraspora malaysiensis TaxID=161358 RepID=UPI003D90D254